MATSTLEKDSSFQDRLLKTRRLAFRVRVEGNATPADKVDRQELPNVAVLRTEGKTAEADAIEDLSADWTTADDGTGVFGVLIKASELGEVDRIVEITATALDGGTVAATALDAGGAQDGLSPEGNIAVELDSSVDLSAADCDILLVVEYYLK